MRKDVPVLATPDDNSPSGLGDTTHMQVVYIRKANKSPRVK